MPAQNLILGGGDIDGALAYATDTNFNDLYGRSSCYRFNGYTGDIYHSSNGYGIIKTTYTSVGYCEQTAYVFNNNSVYVRTKTSSSSSWASWSRCDNFGCNDLSSLASALGGRKWLGQVSDSGHYPNANDLPTNSIGGCSPIATGALNYPPGVQRGFIETVSTENNSTPAYQMFYERAGDSARQYTAIYIRSYIANTWYDWRQIPTFEKLIETSTLLSSLASALKPYLDAL